MNKAKDLKRKYHLEEIKGISRAPYISIASQVGLVLEDGNPSTSLALDNIIELEANRLDYFTANCQNHISDWRLDNLTKDKKDIRLMKSDQGVP
jgi:hypothetical protein